MIRTAEISRKTFETDINVKLNIDGQCRHNISTGIGFFDHMLTAFCVHGKFDLDINCKGDLNVCPHHTVEDVGIVLGKAFSEALGDKSNIERYGCFSIPMDEALATATVDISGRPFLVFNADFSNERIGEFDTCLVNEFLQAFAVNSGITLHAKCEYGNNDHHKIEAIFKALAHSLHIATRNSNPIFSNSTKGTLD